MGVERQKGGGRGEGSRGVEIHLSKFTYCGSGLWVGMLRSWKFVPM